MSMIENLEGRQLLAASLLRVGSVDADNRGTITVRFSEATTGVKGSAMQVYTAGADGKLYTADDQRESIGYSYSVNKKTLTIRAKIAKDKAYRLKLDGKTRIKSAASGTLLDGDYNGTLASGDGNAGGNFEAQFNRDKTLTPTVVMRTSQGDIFLRMRGDVAPKSVSNYLSYANSGRYDNTFVARNDAGFVIQGGSLQITGDGQDASDILPTSKDGLLIDENPGGISNARGTMAFARGSGNDATNEWFINTGANGGLDSQGFTVFAELIKQESFDTIDTISGKPIAALQNGTGSGPNGVLENTANVFLAHVPVTSLSDVTGGSATVSGLGPPGTTETQFLVTGGLQPFNDLMVIYRVAAFMTVSKKG